MTSLFFFGTLRDHDLLEVVLDRQVAPGEVTAARADGFAARSLAGESYPYLARVQGEAATGVVFRPASVTDMSRLEYFEDIEYGLSRISVQTAGGPVEAIHFEAEPRMQHRTQDAAWDFTAWQRDEKDVAIEAAREHMSYLGKLPMGEVDALWTGIKIRAIMRARAKVAVPVTGTLRSPRGPADVEILQADRPYAQFFAVEEHRLRHRRFDGDWSPEMTRSSVVTGDAVTVLPYDAATDQVLMIEQFRAPMLARGDACPWGIEAVAGRLDQERDPEACARREAEEEAGLTLRRVEQIAAYYSSPGFAAEHITSYVGEADLSAAGGLHGAAHENEDIRAFAVSLDEALDAVASGEIDNAPLILSLLWLSRNRERLRAEWAGLRP